MRGAVKVMAFIEDPAFIKKILDHMKEKMDTEPLSFLSSAQAPRGHFG